ncbi:hypothetical protein BYT27DRAFT_6373728 [Phlegmacium glaucopus]|nr:hypothetical protein BYT27DRAFT_6373728 [Phlegmacium glaucopus]
MILLGAWHCLHQCSHEIERPLVTCVQSSSELPTLISSPFLHLVSFNSLTESGRIYYTPPKLANGTIMICHHGAGYSGLSFACLAKEVTEMTKGECGVLSLDARRHGNRFTKPIR